MPVTRTVRSSAILVLALLLSQPILATVLPVLGDAADWGETVGDVLLEHSWGHGSSTNMTMDNTTFDTNVFRLNILEEKANVTDQDVDDGHNFNLTVSNEHKMGLKVIGPSWVRASPWNIPLSDANMGFATPVLGDLDDDGDLDAMVGANINDGLPPTDDGITVGYNNTGDSTDPTWTVDGGWNYTVIDDFPVPALGDLDGDGDLDIMIGAGAGRCYGVENTGNETSPTWTEQTSWDSPDSGNDAAAALVDIDDDGDLDLFSGRSVGDTFAYENTGSASSPTWASNSGWDVPDVGATSNPTFGDLDGDGDHDVLIGNWDGDTLAYENTGTNTSPTWTRKAAWDVEDVGDLASPTLGDLDGDGDLDIEIGELQGDSYGYENQVIRADNGTFKSDAIGVGKVVNWTNVDWGEKLPGNTDVNIYTRSGNTTDPDDGTWSGWSGALSDPGGTNTTTPPGLYTQVRAELSTNNNKTTPQVWSINITYWYYTPEGDIETNDLTPIDLVQWGMVSRSNDSKGETIELWYSTNSGSTWTTAPSDGNLTSLDTSSGKVRFRVNMSTTDPILTPTFTGIDLTYMKLLAAHHLHLDPLALEVTVGDSYQFISELHDINNNTLNKTLSWTSTVGTVDPDGNYTAQTAPGTGFVNTSFNGITASAQITVKVGPLARLNITPSLIITEVGTTVQASVKGLDKYDNELSGLAFNWTSDVGTPSPTSSPITNLTVQTTPGSGHLRVSVGSINASIPVTVRRGPLASIQITPTSIQLNESASISVLAKGYDKYDNEIPAVEFNWATDVGTVQPATGPNTTFTAQDMDDNLTNQTALGELSATNGTISSSINVTVLGEFVQWLSVLEIDPTSAELLPVENVTFNITGYDQFDNVMNVQANWSSDVGKMVPAVGSSSTLFPNVDSGIGVVTATIGDLSVTAEIKVLPNSTYPFPTIMAHIPDQVRLEDSPPWSLDLNPYEGGGQLDNDLIWHLEGLDPKIVTVDGQYNTKDTLTFVPIPNEYGNNRCTIFLEDRQGFTDNQEIWINITPVDDPPFMNPLPDLMIRFDDPYKFNYLPYVQDIDTPANGMSISVPNVKPIDKTLDIQVDGLSITYLAPESSLNTIFTLTIEVTDGTTSVRDEITLKISDNYVPELLLPLPDVTMQEGETKTNVFNLDDHFLDRDKDVIFFTYGNNHVAIIINDDHSVDLASTDQWNGQETVTFRATDSKGSLVEDDVLITVLPVDNAPVIEGIPDLIVHYDDDFTFDLKPYITDPDTRIEEMTLTFSDEHAWWAYDPDHVKDHPPMAGASRVSMVMNFPLDLGGQGVPYNVDLTITVSDGTSLDSDTVRITVTDNWPPQLISTLPNVEFDEDTILTNAFVLSDYFIDKEGQALLYSAQSAILGVRINDDRSVDISAPENWYGIETITFRATDPKGGMVESTIIATVLPVNDPPILDLIETQTVEEKTLLTVTIGTFIHDVDHDFGELTIDVTSSDLGLNVFVTGTAIVLFPDGPGNFTVTVTIQDPEGGKAEGSFRVDVSEASKPVIPPTTDNLLGELFWPILLLISIIVGAVVGYSGYRRYYGKFDINEAFVILKDGRLVAHLSRFPDTGKDETLFSGMVAAVQMFIEDTFKDMKGAKTSTVQKMEFKGNTIMIERGKRMYLAILLEGDPGSKIITDMTTNLEQLEKKYGKIIKDWDGDVSTLKDMSYDLLDIIPGGYSKTIPGSSE